MAQEMYPGGYEDPRSREKMISIVVCPTFSHGRSGGVTHKGKIREKQVSRRFLLQLVPRLLSKGERLVFSPDGIICPLRKNDLYDSAWPYL